MRIFTSIVMLTCLFCAQAFAQALVPVRTGVHGGFTRVVLDWSYDVPYDTQQNAPNQYLLSFRGAADTSGNLNISNQKDILGLKQISTDGTNLQMLLDVQQGRQLRHFKAGNKIVFDVVDPSYVAPVVKAPSKSQPSQNKKSAEDKEKLKEADVKKSQASTEKNATAELVVKPYQEAVKKINNIGDDSLLATAPKTMPAVRKAGVDQETATPGKTVIEQAAPLLAPHVITLTSTRTSNMAAFRRSGWLWMVTDNPSQNVAPQLAGEQSNLFGGFERISLQGGTAYRVKLPAGHETMHFYGEGGGLIWRVVMTPNVRQIKEGNVRRDFEPQQFVRGGKLVWPFVGETKILDVSDPAVGDVLKLIAVEQADQMSSDIANTVDFNVLDSIIGLALQPKVDNLEIQSDEQGVSVSRRGGLALSRMKDISRRKVREDIEEANIQQAAGGGEESSMRRIFDFDRWMMGGLQSLEENQRILLAGMAVKNADGKAQDLLTLAKMNLANDRGQEAIGFLTYALSLLPDLSDSPEFRALRGASAALSGKDEIAFNDLFQPVLKPFDEMDYWRAYSLAALEDWQQAMNIMPEDFTVLIDYPRPLLEKIGLKLAEISLRAGKAEQAKSILSVLEKDRGILKPWSLAALEYLKGEASRQDGDEDEAASLWRALSTGDDDLYRTKAGLALTMLELQKGETDREKAIDRLEGMRYAWRGDELEARVNFMLGRLYIQQDEYLKGLTIMREAASMSPESDMGKEIATYMQQAFRDLLMQDEDLTPLEAVEIYEAFRELTPTDTQGDALVQKLAERLVKADLLGRAEKILEHQVNYRLDGMDKARIAQRLGSIYLLDGNARKAMKYLDMARSMFSGLLSGDEKAQKLREIDLMRARGLSQLNHTEEAIIILNGFPPDADVNRLRADIAWQAGLWDDAAEALQDLILDETLDINRPLTPRQADLVLNYAVSLNLSGDRVSLNNTRERYLERMNKTQRSRLFDVVTRPRKTSILADKETIEAIVNEVDLFEDFLRSYKQD